KHVVHRDRDSGADVVRAAVAPPEGGQVRGGDVPDVQHVARLVAVAVDGDRLALDHPAGEYRHHAPFLRGEVLPGAVDVGVAQGGEGDAECPLEGGEVLLEGELAGAVRRQWPDRMVLVGGHYVGIAVEGASGGAEDDLAHGVVDGGAQDVETAHDVDLCVVARIRDRLRDLGLRGVMVDELGLEGGDGGLHLRQVPHIGAVHARGRVHVVLAPSAHVVEHRNLVPRGDVSIDDVRADESRAASHENLHRS